MSSAPPSESFSPQYNSQYYQYHESSGVSNPTQQPMTYHSGMMMPQYPYFMPPTHVGQFSGINTFPNNMGLPSYMPPPYPPH